jgi:hypothetical protein
LFDLAKTSIISAYQLGYKIFLLIVGWFIALFIIETILHVIVYVIVLIYRNTIKYIIPFKPVTDDASTDELNVNISDKK